MQCKYKDEYNNLITVTIDTELSELLPLLWIHKIYTYKSSSHSKDDGFSHIGFLGGQSYEKFMNIVCCYDSNFTDIDKYEYLTNLEPYISLTDINSYITHNYDDIPPESLDKYKKPYCNIKMLILLKFPKEYINYFVSKFQQYELYSIENKPIIN